MWMFEGKHDDGPNQLISSVSDSSTIVHSNARNARKALRKEKYAWKIKSAQETQQTQINYASKKQKYASASHTTDAIGPCARKRNDRIDSIFHATHVAYYDVWFSTGENRGLLAK